MITTLELTKLDRDQRPIWRRESRSRSFTQGLAELLYMCHSREERLVSAQKYGYTTYSAETAVDERGHFSYHNYLAALYRQNLEFGSMTPGLLRPPFFQRYIDGDTNQDEIVLDAYPPLGVLFGEGSDAVSSNDLTLKQIVGSRGLGAFELTVCAGNVAQVEAMDYAMCYEGPHYLAGCDAVNPNRIRRISSVDGSVLATINCTNLVTTDDAWYGLATSGGFAYVLRATPPAGQGLARVDLATGLSTHYRDTTGDFGGDAQGIAIDPTAGNIVAYRSGNYCRYSLADLSLVAGPTAITGVTATCNRGVAIDANSRMFLRQASSCFYVVDLATNTLITKMRVPHSFERHDYGSMCFDGDGFLVAGYHDATGLAAVRWGRVRYDPRDILCPSTVVYRPVTDAVSGYFDVVGHCINQSGAVLTIEEVGMACLVGLGKSIVIARDLTGGVALANGETLRARYRPSASI